MKHKKVRTQLRDQDKTWKREDVIMMFCCFFFLLNVWFFLGVFWLNVEWCWVVRMCTTTTAFVSAKRSRALRMKWLSRTRGQLDYHFQNAVLPNRGMRWNGRAVALLRGMKMLWDGSDDWSVLIQWRFMVKCHNVCRNVMFWCNHCEGFAFLSILVVDNTNSAKFLAARA